MKKFINTETKNILKILIPKYCRGKVINIGAGRDKYGPLFVQYSEEYVSTDNLSSKYQFSNEEDKKMVGVVCEATDLPFTEKYFDTVICTEVMEHLPNPFALMQEISRVLKVDGFLILAAPWFAPYHPEPKDYYRFSPDAYQYLCESNNLAIIETISQGGFLNIYWYLLMRTVYLHGLKSKKVFEVLKPVTRIIQKLVDWFDYRINSKDNTGYIVVAKKMS